MKKVSAAEFKRKTGAYQDMALSEPVMITKHDRPTLVLLSYAEYQKLAGAAKKVSETPRTAERADLPRVAIEALKMDRMASDKAA